MSLHVDTKAIPQDVMTLCRELDRHGYKGWVVGGCLRDLLRGKPAADWDVATSALPTDVQRIFKRVIPTGIQHGTVTVRLGGHGYEVTTLRGEGSYSDGRRPDSVEFVSDIAADLARRDFTINAIAYDPLADVLIDPFGGLADLEARVIRAVGRAEERFGEDGLRVLRAARFAAVLEFSIDDATERAISPTLDTFRKVSAERVREEWLKALKACRPALAFEVMARSGILAVTFPELAARADLTCALRAVDLAPVDANLRLAALFAGFREALPVLDAWLARYRFANHERTAIGALVRFHAEAYRPLPDDAELRRAAARWGRERIDAILTVARVVARAREDAESLTQADAIAARMPSALTPTTPLIAKELAVSGGDLMKALGLAPGPRIGALVETLLARAIDDPTLNDRARLLDLARALANEA